MRLNRVFEAATVLRKNISATWNRSQTAYLMMHDAKRLVSLRMRKKEAQIYPEYLRSRMTYSENTGKKETADTLLEELSGELRREKFRRRYRKLSAKHDLCVWSGGSCQCADRHSAAAGAEDLRHLHESQSDGGRHCGFGEVTPLETGDVIAFYYNNRVLVKRVTPPAERAYILTPPEMYP